MRYEAMPRSRVAGTARVGCRAALVLLLAAVGCAGEPAVAPGEPEPVAIEAIGHVERLDPALDALVPPGATIEVLADGFDWSEGPVWVEPGGYLLFSDVPADRIYIWREGEGHRTWLEPSGYTGNVPRGGEPGSNGLLIDDAGRLVLCQHGDRRVARLDAPLEAPEPRFETVADRHQGRRFNSPNDLTLHSSGAIYFTDPPYGLVGGPDDPSREIDVNGVYRVDPDSSVTLLIDDLSRPNGLAFSPDEGTLYVANSDPERAVWMAYDVLDDGTVANGRVFFDATELAAEHPGLPDGLEVDAAGNLFATGPGGVLVFDARGRHLGTIDTTQATANCAFGDGGAVLYMTADRYLLRIRLAGAE